MPGPAKVYRFAHPRTPWCVVYLDPGQREKTGRAKRVRKWFADAEAAATYTKDLNRRLAREGTSGVAFDAAERADYHGAKALLQGEGCSLTLTEIARDYLQRHPHRAATERPLDELRAEFLQEKRAAENAAERTIGNLDLRLRQWARRQGLAHVGQISRASIEAVRAREGVGAATRKNDMNAVSSFCSWLVEKHLLDHNPVRGMRRPKVVPGPVSIWSNDEVRRLMTAAQAVQGGRFVGTLAVLLWGGLRPDSELQHASIVYAHPPAVRVEGGKLRGRANRIVPLPANAVAWLRVAGKPLRVEPLTVKGRAGLCARASVTWREDICRHTCISHRLARGDDEATVAREAGTSPEVIYRRYLRLRTRTEAREFFGLRPKKAAGGRRQAAGES